VRPKLATLGLLDLEINETEQRLGAMIECSLVLAHAFRLKAKLF